MQSFSYIRRVFDTIPGSILQTDGADRRRRGEEDAYVLHNPSDEEGGQLDKSDALPSEEPIDETSDDSELKPIFEVPAEFERSGEKLLSDVVGDEIRQAVRTKGIDALGWYVSFHTTRQPGVFITPEGMAFLADEAFLGLRISLERRLELAFRAILQHELLHFAADYMCAQWELAIGKPCWVPSRELRDKESGYIKAEEQLANAYMLRRFRFAPVSLRSRGAYRSLLKWTTQQPPGYRDAAQIADKTKFLEACRCLSHEYRSAMHTDWWMDPYGFDHENMFGGLPQIDPRHCPIFLANTGIAVPFSVRFIDRIAAIETTDNFNRQLAKLGCGEKWDETRRKLAITTLRKGLDFKKWPPGGDHHYSVRLDRDLRAHLQNDSARRLWIAYEVGRGDELGHH